MPNPMFLKIMDMEIEEYNTLTPSEKEEFQVEARQRIADLAGDDDANAYSDFTKTLVEKPARAPRTFKRSKRNKETE